MMVLEKVHGVYWWHGHDGLIRADSGYGPKRTEGGEELCEVRMPEAGVLELVKSKGLVVKVIEREGN